MAVMRTFLLVCLGATLLAVSGCGGAPVSTSAPRGAEAASVAPADTAAYVGIVTDDDSQQWQRLESLVGRFPDGDRLIGSIARQLSGQGLDWEHDVKPALGPVTAIVLLPGAKEPVVLTKPSLRAKLDALLGRTGKNTVTAPLDDGWFAVAEHQAALDAFDAAATKGDLADEQAFQEAVGELPADALATVYVRPAALAGSLPKLPIGITPSAAPLAAAGKVESVAAAVVVEEDGLRVEGAVRSDDALATGYDPVLLDRVPGDAVLAVSFHGSKDLAQQLDGALPIPRQSLEQTLGVQLDDLLQLVEGEGVLYVRSGLPIPEATLAVETSDEAGAVATLDRLTRHLGAPVETGTAVGIETHAVRLGPVRLTWAAADGVLVLSTSPTAIADFRSDGAKLVDEDAFRSATKRVGFEGSTAGLVYADLPRVVQLVRGLAELSGEQVPAEAVRNLEPLRTFAANARTDGGVLRFEAVLTVGGS